MCERILCVHLCLLVEKLKDERTFRTELCPEMTKLGTCVYGSACTFAHGAEQLRRRERGPKCGTHARTHAFTHAARATHPHTHHWSLLSVGLMSCGFLIRYKSELCSNFERYGRCDYGKRCEFAHGHAELLSPKYAARTSAAPCDQHRL